MNEGRGALGMCMLFAFGLTACAAGGSPEPFTATAPLTYTTNFVGEWTEAEKQDVELGFAAWPIAVAYDLDVVRVTDRAPQTKRCKSSRDGVPAGDELEGYTYEGSTMCLYVDDIGRDGNVTLAQIAAHEYGHALGVVFGDGMHYEGEAPSLMKPDADDDTQLPQAVDLAALATHIEAQRPH